MKRFKRNLRKMSASYLRAVAATTSTLQVVVHGGGVSISAGWQVLGAVLGAAVAPFGVFLVDTADQLDDMAID